MAITTYETKRVWSIDDEDGTGYSFNVTADNTDSTIDIETPGDYVSVEHVRGLVKVLNAAADWLDAQS
jgi:hypothetical protein